MTNAISQYFWNVVVCVIEKRFIQEFVNVAFFYHETFFSRLEINPTVKRFVPDCKSWTNHSNVMSFVNKSFNQSLKKRLKHDDVRINDTIKIIVQICNRFFDLVFISKHVRSIILHFEIFFDIIVENFIWSLCKFHDFVIAWNETQIDQINSFWFFDRFNKATQLVFVELFDVRNY